MQAFFFYPVDVEFDSNQHWKYVFDSFTTGLFRNHLAIATLAETEVSRPRVWPQQNQQLDMTVPCDRAHTYYIHDLVTGLLCMTAFVSKEQHCFFSQTGFMNYNTSQIFKNTWDLATRSSWLICNTLSNTLEEWQVSEVTVLHGFYTHINLVLTKLSLS